MRWFVVIFLLLAISSCGLFHNVAKHKETRKEKVSLKVDSVVNKEITTKDQSKIVTNEKGKGLYNPPSMSVNWSTSFNPDSLVSLNLFKTAYGLISIATSLNSLGNGVNQEATFEPFPVPIDYDRTTITDLNIEMKERYVLEFEKEEKKELKETELDVKKEGKNAFWWVVILVGAIVILAVLFMNSRI